MSSPVVPPVPPTEDTSDVGAAPLSAVANWLADVGDAVPTVELTGRALRDVIRAWIAAIWAVTAARSPVPGLGTELTGAVIGHSPAARRGRLPGRRSRPSLVAQRAARGSWPRPDLGRAAPRRCGGRRRRRRGHGGDPAHPPTSGR